MKDMLGQKFHRLKVLEFSHSNARGLAFWKVKCDCGTIKSVAGSQLRMGGTKSCGCFQSELASKNATKHGMVNLPGYITWMSMRARVRRNEAYAGIKICKRWDSFAKFIKDMGPRPGPKYSIDRIDNKGDYRPGNCRWATMTEQNNNKRTNVMVTHEGETLTLKQWSRKLGVNYSTLKKRFRKKKCLL